MLFCTIRNYHDVEPKIASSLGGNGYSLNTHTEILGAGNPYVYPKTPKPLYIKFISYLEYRIVKKLRFY